MVQAFDAVYEKGVLKPLEPLHLVDGVRVRVTLSPPEGPLTEEQVHAMIRMGQTVFEGLSEEEVGEIEGDIMPGRSSPSAS